MHLHTFGSLSVTIIITDRSGHANDDDITHFPKIKSLWITGDRLKTRDRISIHGNASEKSEWPPVDQNGYGGRISANDRVVGFVGDVNPSVLLRGQQSRRARPNNTLSPRCFIKCWVIGSSCRRSSQTEPQSSLGPTLAHPASQPFAGFGPGLDNLKTSWIFLTTTPRQSI